MIRISLKFTYHHLSVDTSSLSPFPMLGMVEAGATGTKDGTAVGTGTCVSLPSFFA